MASGTVSPVGGAALGGTAGVTFSHGADQVQVSSDLSILWDLDNDGDWSEAVEDVTPYVLAVECQTGRDKPARLGSRTEPSKARLTLRNDDGRFSPFNTLSPLTTAPYSLRTGRRLRIATTADVDDGSSTISYVGAGAAVGGDNVSLTPEFPEGLEDGDLILIVASVRTTSGSVNIPVGWAALPDENGDPLTVGNVSVLARIYQAGDGLGGDVEADEPPLVTFANTGGAGATTLVQAFAFRGTERQLSRLVAASASQTNTSAQNIALPGLTMSDADLACIVIGWKQAALTSVNTLAGQFFTEAAETSSSSGNDASHAVQYRVQGAALNFFATSLVVTGGGADTATALSLRSGTSATASLGAALRRAPTPSSSSAVSKGIVIALRPAPVRAEPTLLARDRFDRDNGPVLGSDELGNVWEQSEGGGFSIQDLGAAALNGSWAALIFGFGVTVASTVDVGTPDHYVQLVVRRPVNDGRVGLVARWVDDDNCLRLYYDGATRTVRLDQVTGGSAFNLLTYLIEAWDGMTLGLEVFNQSARIVLGGQTLYGGINLARNIAGDRCGVYGRWFTTSDVRPAVDDFHVWERLPCRLDGVMFTGRVTSVKPSSPGTGLQVVELEAEGMLASAALVDVAAPRIVRSVGETASSANYGVPPGCAAGDALARAGLAHPPWPSTQAELSPMGPLATADGKALDIAHEVALVGRGLIRELPEGYVTYEDFGAREAVGPVAWFTDTTGRGQVPVTLITPHDSSSHVVNRAIARVAPTCPTVVSSTSIVGTDDSDLQVAVTIPDSIEGDLILVTLVTSAFTDGVEWAVPGGWVELRRMGQNQGMRVYATVIAGGEQGTTHTFYDSGAIGDFAGRMYVIRDWHGDLSQGLKVGNPVFGIATGGERLPGTNAYPLDTGWSVPALFILEMTGLRSTAGIVIDEDRAAPVGYDRATIASVGSPGSTTYETAEISVYKRDITESEAPVPWLDVLDDTWVRETTVIAVRGYEGPLGKPSDRDSRAVGQSGNFVVVDDFDSQAEHNAVLSNREIPAHFYTAGHAREWCDWALGLHADDRPVVSVTFGASRSAAARRLAKDLRVSDRVTLTATGRSNLGFERSFFVEAINHRWSNGVHLWTVTLDLSPAD